MFFLYLPVISLGGGEGRGRGVVFGPPPNHFSYGPSTNNVDNFIILLVVFPFSISSSLEELSQPLLCLCLHLGLEISTKINK